MPGFLWPTTKKPEPNLLGRLGRVLHWTLTSYSFLVLLLALLNFSDASSLETSTGIFAPDGTPSEETPQEAAQWHWEQGTKWLFHSLGAFIGGRVVRYVLSAE
jgi:hypothetical protein